jgi:hypothetical protein
MIYPRVLCAISSLGLVVLCIAKGETVDDLLRQVREAGLADRAGTMPENASLLGSFEFEDLERKLPGIYGSTKQTFRLAAEHWEKMRNSGRTPDEPQQEVSTTLRLMLRNQFLHQVEAFIPDLTRNVYSDADRRRINELLLGTPPPANDDWQTPNNRLAKHFSAYLDDLIVNRTNEPEPIFKRLLGELDRRAEGAPLGGGLAPKWGRMNISIATAAGLAQAVEVKIKYLRTGLNGHQESDTFYSNPGTHIIPTGTWIVTASSKGFTSQAKEVEIKEGETTVLQFTLAPTLPDPAVSPPASPRAARESSLPPLTPGELAVINRFRKAGAVVVDYDPRPLSAAWQALPPNYADILRPHSAQISIQLSPGEGRGFAADMTGQPANPAFNDPRLKVKLELVRNGKPTADAVETGKYTEDIVWCVAQWVNATRNLAETSFEPLSSIQVNEAFFSRLEARYWSEESRASVDAMQWKHYISWNKKSWEAAAARNGAPGRFFSRDQSAETTDLTIKLLYGTTSSLHGRFTPEDTGHHGLIEIYMDGASGKVLPQADFLSSTEPRKYSFRRILLHEFGHYLGLKHLPRPATPGEKEIFANCIMNDAYTLIGDGILPADGMASSHASFLSLDVRGRRCKGLDHEAPISAK